MSAPPTPESIPTKPPAPEAKPAAARFYYVVSESESLKGPALFTEWEDCRFYLELEEEVKYKKFASLSKAIQYLADAAKIHVSVKSGDSNKSVSTAADATANAAATTTAVASVPAAPASPERAKGVRQQNFDSRFESFIKLLKTYKEKFGHVNVNKKNDKIPGGGDEFYGLGYWLYNMRLQIKLYEDEDADKKKIQLSKEQYDALTEIGVRKDTKMTVEERLDSNLARLRAYIEEKGTDQVPENCALKSNAEDLAKYKGLGEWTKQMRRQVRNFQKGKETDLNQQMVNRLLSSGLTLQRKKREAPEADEKEARKKARREKDDWDEKFAQLQQFKEEHGHVNVPFIPRNDLRQWVERVRLHYRSIKKDGTHTTTLLSPERIVQLATLGFELQVAKRLPWDERALEWLEYKTRHGHDPKGDDTLSLWCRKMRRLHRDMESGKKVSGLTQEQADKLTSWGFRWDYIVTMPATKEPSMTWDERFEELKEYQQLHGDTLVPQSYPGLGQWVKKQRAEYAKFESGHPHKLKPNRIAKLKGIDFCFRVREARPRKMPQLQQQEEKVEQQGEESDKEQEEEAHQQPSPMSRLYEASRQHAAAAAAHHNPLSSWERFRGGPNY